MKTPFKTILLLVFVEVVSGCVNDSGTSMQHRIENDLYILKQFSREDPDHFKSMAVYRADPSGTVLCFRTIKGETYIYRSTSKMSEKVEHAKFIGPKEVTKLHIYTRNRQVCLFYGPEIGRCYPSEQGSDGTVICAVLSDPPDHINHSTHSG